MKILNTAKEFFSLLGNVLLAIAVVGALGYAVCYIGFDFQKAKARHIDALHTELTTTMIGSQRAKAIVKELRDLGDLPPEQPCECCACDR